jgi:hypothetical protein
MPLNESRGNNYQTGTIFANGYKYGRIRKHSAEHRIKFAKCNSTEVVLCLCGCGGKVIKFDDHGREKKYLYGHRGKKNGY